MSKIRYNNKIIEVEEIISYGCSFTAGDELLEHVINPKADNIKRSRGVEYWKDKFNVHTLKIKKSLYQKEGKLAWPGQVAERLELPFSNKAIGGSSIDKSIFALEKDFYEGNIKPNSLILFGLTNVDRIGIYNKSGFKTILLSSDILPEYIDRRSLLETYTDQILYINYLNNIERIINFVKVHELNIILVPMSIRLDSMHRIGTKEILNEDENFIDKKYQYIINQSILFHQTLFSFAKDRDKDFHGGGHPKIHVHKKLADAIVCKLQEDLL